MSIDPCKANPDDPSTSGSELQQWLNILVEMSVPKEVVYSLLVASVAIAVVPQHVKFFRKRTHEGVSMTSLLMQNIKLFSVAANTILLKQQQIKACTFVGISECMPSLFSLLQNTFAWIFCFPFMVYWVIFFKSPKRNPKHFLFGIFSLIGFLVFFIIISGVGVLFSVHLGPCANPTLYLAKSLGIFAAMLTVIEWAPQIWTTFWTKAARTLSLPMVCVFAPGTLVGAGFMIFVSKDTWSTWLPQLVSGIQLFILLGLLFYFSPQKEKMGKCLQKLSKKPTPTDLAGCGVGDVELNELPAEVHSQPDKTIKVGEAGGGAAEVATGGGDTAQEKKDDSEPSTDSSKEEKVIVQIENTGTTGDTKAKTSEC